MPINFLSDPDLMEKTILNREWIKNRKREELVEIVIDLTTEIANQMGVFFQARIFADPLSGR